MGQCHRRAIDAQHFVGPISQPADGDGELGECLAGLAGAGVAGVVGRGGGLVGNGRGRR